jgi:hypothetical protein
VPERHLGLRQRTGHVAAVQQRRGGAPRDGRLTQRRAAADGVLPRGAEHLEGALEVTGPVQGAGHQRPRVAVGALVGQQLRAAPRPVAQPAHPLARGRRERLLEGHLGEQHPLGRRATELVGVQQLLQLAADERPEVDVEVRDAEVRGAQLLVQRVGEVDAVELRARQQVGARRLAPAAGGEQPAPVLAPDLRAPHRRRDLLQRRGERLPGPVVARRGLRPGELDEQVRALVARRGLVQRPLEEPHGGRRGPRAQRACARVAQPAHRPGVGAPWGEQQVRADRADRPAVLVEQPRGAGVVVGRPGGRQRVVHGGRHERVDEAQRLARLEQPGVDERVGDRGRGRARQPGQPGDVPHGRLLTQHRDGSRHGGRLGRGVGDAHRHDRRRATGGPAARGPPGSPAGPLRSRPPPRRAGG